MGATYARTFWKQKVDPGRLTKVREAAKRIDPTGKIMRETDDLVRVSGTVEQIQALEKEVGLPDAEYWAEKPPAGSIIPPAPKPAAAAASAPASAPTSAPAAASATAPAPPKP